MTDQPSDSDGPDESAFATLGNEAFVSLSTFRKTGEAVATAVWIARDGEALIVTTPQESGKIKRLRNNPRVEMRSCSRFGKVKEGALPVSGTAEILSAQASAGPLATVIPRKYGLEYRIIMAVERLRDRQKKPRVLLRITSAS
ncbi:MAG: PPOX class F420-dependent oxidoreductase [Pseudonocardia sp.]|nr:PPOX class F420-dependent oxidoreductase [Pseudonocardia sp.]